MNEFVAVYSSKQVEKDVTEQVKQYFVQKNRLKIPWSASFNELFNDIHPNFSKTLTIKFDSAETIVLSESRTSNFKINLQPKSAKWLEESKRKEKYYQLVNQIQPYPLYPQIRFQTSGKLVIALFEFRPLELIKNVVNGILKIYKPEEIGLAIVFGTQNDSFVRDYFKEWSNVILINTGDYNHDGTSYSQRLKTPELWEKFDNFQHVLVMQCDTLLLKKIPEVYFNFDYIGAPWSIESMRYLAGNGGFSLRNVNAMINVCDQFRGKKLTEIQTEPNYEDVFFCKQPNLKLPTPADFEIHRAFSVEMIFHHDPVGLHDFCRFIDDPKQFDTLIQRIKAL